MLKVQGTTWMSGCIEVWYDKIASRVSVETFALGQDWQSRGSIQPVTFNPGDQFGARALANGSVKCSATASRSAPCRFRPGRSRQAADASGCG